MKKLIKAERPLILTFIAWAVLAAGYVWYDRQVSYEELMKVTAMIAETAVDRDILYRRWAADRNGVYVRVDDKNQPNPYLAGNPNRDIVRSDGTVLTLVNPAYMTRQVHEMAKVGHGVSGHLTSLKPLRPENTPDPWEADALQTFDDKRQATALSVENSDGEQRLRFMKALPVTASCLPCHEAQGYKVGDVRGGLSVTVPFSPIAAIIDSSHSRHARQMAFVWLPAAAGLFLVRQRYKKRLADELKLREGKAAMERRIEQAQRLEALGTLAGGVAHDFNNILTIVTGYSQLLLDTAPEGSPERENLGTILQAAERARDLVKSLLAFSRQAEDENLPMPVAQTVKEFAKMLRPTIPSTIEMISSVREVGVVCAGRTDIQQILMNLCTNAYHAMRGTSGRLTIALDKVVIPGAAGETGHSLVPGNYAQLVVSDTGTGMETETLSRIFDPFFTTKPLGEGTGLGLSIVHGIVQRLKGSITVQSTVGEGSRFTVRLPLREEDAPLPFFATATPRGGERILVVDDEHHIAAMLQLTLQHLGYEAVAVHSAFQAIEKLAGKDFDLLITDQTMPRMTGIELVRQVVTERRLKAILTTGYSEQVEEADALAAGAAGFIQKPYEKATLARVIRNVLDGPAGEAPSAN